MTERGEIRYGDSRIAYQVVRSTQRRKTIEVTVDAPGVVTVAAPTDTPPEHIEATVRRRAGWIIKHDGEAAAALPPRRFVSGESLPYLGRSVPLTVHRVDGKKMDIRFHHWQFDIDVPRSLDGDQRIEVVRAAFEDWYRDRAAVKLPAPRRPHREPPRRAPDADPRSGPAQALGELRARRDAPLQLAHGDGAARARRLHRGA